MRRRFHLKLLMPLAVLSLALMCRPAHAVSCSMSPALPETERTALADAAGSVGNAILHGNTSALKAASTAQLASGFAPVAATVTSIASELDGATFTMRDIYALHAADLKSTGDDVQFFCSVPGSQLLVTVTLGELPPGEYALVLAHATGVAAPQQFAIILQDTATAGAVAHWELAGLTARPLTVAGYDSLWFWTQARALKAKNQPLNSFLYYEAASYLARPADLFTSNNLGKLSRETAAVEPPGLPGGKPMQLAAEGENFPVTGLSCDGTLGPLDLRVDTRFDQTGDPVAARRYALALMAALLSRYPELRTGFHGLWVYETGANGGSFAVEQPMTALP